MAEERKSQLDLESEAGRRVHDRFEAAQAKLRARIRRDPDELPRTITVRPSNGYERVMDEDGTWIEGPTEVAAGNGWVLRRIREGSLELVASEEAQAALAQAKEDARARVQQAYEQAKAEAAQQGEPEPPPPPPPEPEPAPEEQPQPAE